MTTTPTRPTRRGPAPVDAGPKTCGCGAEFRRRRDESFAKYAKRQSCSRACGHAATHRIGEAGAAALAAVRNCRCGKVLVRRDGEAPSEFAARKLCGHGCRHVEADALMATLPTSRVCAHTGCEVEFTRPPYVSAARWAKARYCSQAHQRAGVAEAASAGAADRDRRRNTRKQERRRAKSRAPALAEAGLSVFGDRPPAERWRPASWRDPELARGTAHTAA